MLFQTCMTYFLQWDTKYYFLKNILAAFLSIMKVNGDGCCLAPEEQKKHHKCIHMTESLLRPYDKLLCSTEESHTGLERNTYRNLILHTHILTYQGKSNVKSKAQSLYVVRDFSACGNDHMSIIARSLAYIHTCIFGHTPRTRCKKSAGRKCWCGREWCQGAKTHTLLQL